MFGLRLGSSLIHLNKHLNFIAKRASKTRTFSTVHYTKNFKLWNSKVNYYIAVNESKTQYRPIINQSRFLSSSSSNSHSSPNSNSHPKSPEVAEAEFFGKDQDGNIILYNLSQKKARQIKYSFFFSVLQAITCTGIGPMLLYQPTTYPFMAQLLGGFLPIFGISILIIHNLIVSRYIHQLAISEDTKKIRISGISLFGRKKEDLDSYDVKLNEVEKKGIQAMIKEGLTIDEIRRRVQLITLKTPSTTYFVELNDISFDKLQQFFEIMKKYENE